MANVFYQRCSGCERSVQLPHARARSVTCEVCHAQRADEARSQAIAKEPPVQMASYPAEESLDERHRKTREWIDCGFVAPEYAARMCPCESCKETSRQANGPWYDVSDYQPEKPAQRFSAGDNVRTIPGSQPSFMGVVTATSVAERGQVVQLRTLMGELREAYDWELVAIQPDAPPPKTAAEINPWGALNCMERIKLINDWQASGWLDEDAAEEMRREAVRKTQMAVKP